MNSITSRGAARWELPQHGKPAAQRAADRPAPEASRCPQGAVFHPSGPAPRMPAVLPSPLTLQAGNAEPQLPRAARNSGQDPQTHPAPLVWPLAGVRTWRRSAGTQPMLASTADKNVFMYMDGICLAARSCCSWAGCSPGSRPGTAGSGRNFVPGWLLAVQRAPGVCRASVIQSAVLAENMFATFLLLRCCPFQPACWRRLHNCLGWLAGRKGSVPMEWGWISCRHSREGPRMGRAIIAPETPWLEAADCVAEALTQVSPKSRSSLCDRAVAGEEGTNQGSPREVPRGLRGAGGGSVAGGQCWPVAPPTWGCTADLCGHCEP